MKLHNSDCMDVMRSMEDNSVDLIATDPPYFKVKNEDWDRQWDKPDCFLKWLDGVLVEFHRILKPNGSLYVFASPQMAARVEVAISSRFHVLNNIRWVKSAGWHQKTRKEDLRQYLSPWEACIFAEHYGSDNIAKGEAGYSAKCDELRGFLFESLRAYLAGERDAAGWTTGMVDSEWQRIRSSKGCMAGHWFGRSQFQLPLESQYMWLRSLFGGDYLKREYDDLKREYDDLRRPFSVTADVPFSDVWDFPTVQAHKGKHPCAKPVEMMAHIISSSSKAGAVVFDPFMGGGSTGVAAQMLGREFIGCEMSPEYFEITKERLSQKDLLAA